MSSPVHLVPEEQSPCQAAAREGEKDTMRSALPQEVDVITWTPYVWAAILIAATAGFGYGIAAAVGFASGLGSGQWVSALVHAHGHLQIFGWGGLMVLGVGFFFLPRLRGAPLAHPRALPWILAALAAGLVLRAVAQPLGSVSPSSVASGGLLLSAFLEFSAATAAVWVLWRTSRGGPPLNQRAGLLPVLPYLVLAFAAMWIALGANLLSAARALADSSPTVSAGADNAVVLLGLDGFLVAVSIAMAARSFPLFLWLRTPTASAIRLPFWPFAAGLFLRVLGGVAGFDGVGAVGAILEGLALVTIPVFLGFVPPRRRAGVDPSTDPHFLTAVEYLLVPAFVWLMVGGLVQMGTGLSAVGLPVPAVPDLERHALGSGFVTLLILGMGQRMLPGFGGHTIWSPALVWTTAALGNASALLRGVPVLAASLGWVPAAQAGWISVSLALSGALGLAAVLCFGLNLSVTFRRARARSARG